MKKIIRDLCIGLFLIFAWPFFLYKKYGAKKYKPENNTLIVANHYSNFDPFFIYLIYGKRKIYFVTIKEVKKKLLSRFVCTIFDCMFLDYGTANYGFFKQSINILNNGGIICIFPEGVINPRKYGFFDFKASFVYIAKKTSANILPLYIYPELRLFKRSKIYIGDVIRENEYNQYDDIYDASTYVQSKIMEYSLTF